MKKLRENKGITLIALIVTIIVLLVLANVAFNVILGENGMIEKAANAKEATETEREKEIVNLSVTAVELYKKSENPTSKITVDDCDPLEKEVQRYDKNTKVEKKDEKTLVVTFSETNREYKVIFDENVKIEYNNNNDVNEEPEEIASPQDLFIFEVIDMEKKTAKLTLNQEQLEGEDIYYEGEKINKLVIPAETEINGEKYKITQMNIMLIKELEDYNGNTRTVEVFPNITELYCPNSIENIEISKLDGDGLAYVRGESLEKVVLPQKMTEIPEWMFACCIKLKEIKMPEDVEYIGEGAFAMCGSLKEITIPEGVKYISDYAFNGCKLEKVNLPSTLEKIGIGAFALCEELESIELPSTLKNIEYGAFAGCASLKEINIPEHITSIGGSVFERCNALNQITIPEGVTDIDEDAFYGCTELKTINIKQPEGSIEGAPWGAENATVNWDYTGE